VTFAYDAVGRRTVMVDPSGRTTYTYDAAGRLTVQAAAPGKAITYAYDAVGNRATMVDPDGGTTTYAYDARNGLTSLVNPLQERTTWMYDVVGRIVTLTHANGATAGYSYNAAGWVTSLVNAKSSAVTITSHAYSYDAVGNPIGMTEANGDVLTWTYDALNQLTHEQRSGDNAYDLTYTYDPVGNRLTKLTGGVTTTYTYDAANELTLEDAGGTLTTYSYDENGNTLVWNASGSRTTLTWGYEDEVLTAQPSSGDPVTMTYDADHMRRQRAEGAATARYLWDGAQILMDLDGSDATVARYTQAPFGYGDLLSQRRSNATSFYHFDALGSTRALTESDEDISDTYLYDAWGVLKASTGSTINPYRYVGKLGYLREAALDGYLLRRRYYREGMGRFVSVDPAGMATPAYAYAANKPLLNVGPSGLLSWPPSWWPRSPKDQRRPPGVAIATCDPCAQLAAMVTRLLDICNLLRDLEPIYKGERTGWVRGAGTECCGNKAKFSWGAGANSPSCLQWAALEHERTHARQCFAGGPPVGTFETECPAYREETGTLLMFLEQAKQDCPDKYAEYAKRIDDRAGCVAQFTSKTGCERQTGHWIWTS
jgi:RHS repeat-associated protein